MEIEKDEEELPTGWRRLKTGGFEYKMQEYEVRERVKRLKKLVIIAIIQYITVIFMIFHLIYCFYNHLC